MRERDVSRAGITRRTGIDIIGDVPWGTHFCQFYQTKQDLIDTLAPYFKAGLESNEFCMWVTAEPLGVEEAAQALRQFVPDLDRRLAEGQIEIIPHTDWYQKGGSFDRNRVLNGWVEKLDAALARGYEGLRLTGNTFWLEKNDWEDFTDYEEAVNSVIGNYRMLAICTYSVEKCGASEIVDVVANHEFAIMKRGGKWNVIESSTVKQAQQALNVTLERLEARTGELEGLNTELAVANEELRVANDELHQEIGLREAAEESLRASNKRLEITSDTAARLLVSDSPQEEMEELCRRVMKHLDCQVFFNFLVDEKAGRLHLNACAGIPKATAKSMEWLDYGVAVCGSAARDAERIVAASIQSTSDARTELVKSFGIEAYACHPLLSLGGRVIGTLSFGTRKRTHFTDKELALMKTITDQVAAAMERKRLYEAEHHRVRELDKLNRTLKALSSSSRAMTRAVNEPEYLHEVCDIVVKDCGHAMLWIGYAEDDEAKSVGPVAYSGFEEGYLETLKITWADTERGRGPTGTAIRTGKPAGCANMLTDPKFRPWRAEAIKRGYASSMAAPLMAGGKAFGAITVYSREPDTFSEEEVGLLSQLADDVSFGVAAIRLREERERADEALRRAKEEWEQTFDTVPDMIAILDDHHKIIRVNRAMAERLGATPDKCIGLRCYEAIHGASEPPGFCPLCHTCQDGREHAAEVHEPGLGGDFLVTTTPRYDEHGRLMGAVHVARDITDRKRAEDETQRLLTAVQLEKERLLALVNSINDEVWFTDTQSKFSLVNPPALREFGFSPTDDLDVEKIAKSLEVYRADGSPRPVEEHPPLLALKGEVISNLEEIVRTGASGELRHRQVSAAPVRDPDGNIIGSVSVVRDITQRKRLEAELADRLGDLQDANEALQLVNEIATDFLTAASLQHSLETILDAAKKLIPAQAYSIAVYQGEDTLRTWVNDMGDYACAVESAIRPGDGFPNMTKYSHGLHIDNDCANLRLIPDGHMPMRNLLALGFEATGGWAHIFVANKEGGFREQDARKVEMLAKVATIIIGRATLDEKRQELFEREQNIANVLQRALVPDADYDVPGCEIAVRYEASMKEATVGGDFYDVFDLDEGKIGVLIGDVAGKGLSAAIRVAAARHAIRSYAYLDPRPSKVMSLANNALCKDRTDGSGMLTAFFAVVDTRLGAMTYANGGHETPMVKNAAGEIELLDIPGRALGMIEGFDYLEGSRRLQPEDIVLFLTDGITEARTADFAFFGLEGVRDYLEKTRLKPLEKLAEGLLTAAKTHGEGSLKDDAAILVFRLKGNRK